MTSPTWNPAQYHRYGNERLRPALDLFTRIALDAPDLVHEVGCGRGDIARLAARRWPDARVIGSDTSLEMLDAAASLESMVEWIQLDVRDWDPPVRPDLIFANAVLHWVDDHDAIIPLLFESLAPGGVLAVQMPLTVSEPTFNVIRQALATGGPRGAPLGNGALRASYERTWVQRPEWYHELLAPRADTLDVWVTRYFHELEGDDPVFEWVRGAALRPVLSELDGADLERFSTLCKAGLREAYPRRPNGTTLLGYPRLFIVARR